ncbi:MAG: iron-containing alcohol dehydrogenase family protein [Desulfitobacteriaceae bacterium]
MHLSMASANAYVQEQGLMKKAGEWLEKYGKKLFIVGGKTAWSKVSAVLEPSLKEYGLAYEVAIFAGESSYEEVERLQKLVPDELDLIVGVGGGKALDATKVVAARLGIPFVAIPTVAGTCSCVTHISVMYTPDGLFVDFINHPQNSILTLVDAEIIADSPVSFMLSGIGDTLAKWYEGIVCARGHEDHVPTKLGLSAAKICLDTLTEYSEIAIKDMGSKTPSNAVQQITDAIFLSAGAVGGFGMENTRACAAHGVHDGLTVVKETHPMMHGMKVAYGIIALMYIDNQPAEEIERIKGFYRKIGLPASLLELGVERKLSDEELERVANLALSPTSFMRFMPYPVNAEMITEAMKKTE